MFQSAKNKHKGKCEICGLADWLTRKCLYTISRCGALPFLDPYQIKILANHREAIVRLRLASNVMRSALVRIEFTKNDLCTIPCHVSTCLWIEVKIELLFWDYRVIKVNSNFDIEWKTFVIYTQSRKRIRELHVKLNRKCVTVCRAVTRADEGGRPQRMNRLRDKIG